MDSITAHAYGIAVEERIRDLWTWRAWYRRQPNFAVWLDLARDNDRELRALVTIARRARRLAAAAPDSVDSWKRYRDDGWSEAELATAAGR